MNREKIKRSNEKKKETTNNDTYENPFKFSQEVLDGGRKVIATLPPREEDTKNGKTNF